MEKKSLTWQTQGGPAEIAGGCNREGVRPASLGWAGVIVGAIVSSIAGRARKCRRMALKREGCLVFGERLSGPVLRLLHAADSSQHRENHERLSPPQYRIEFRCS